MGSEDGRRTRDGQSGTRVMDILQSRRRNSDITIPKGMQEGRYSRSGGFLEAIGYAPTSPFGQFVILSDAIAWTSRELPKFIFIKTRQGTQEPLERDRIQIVAMQDSLRTLREVRREIGHEIFGEKADAYAQRVDETLRLAPVGGSRGIREERIALYKKLGEDVKKNFPFTSR